MSHDDERITAQIPAVSVSELLSALDQPPPPPDPDTFDPPTNPRNRMFAKGTEQSLKRIDPDEEWVHPSRLPTEPMFAVEPEEWEPLADDEIEIVLDTLSRS